MCKLIGSVFAKRAALLTISLAAAAIIAFSIDGREPPAAPPSNTPALNAPLSNTLAPDQFAQSLPRFEQEISPAPLQTVKLSGWDKKWWIEKTSRVLRAGQGIGPFEEMAELEALTQDQVIEKLMADDRFADAVLDFNLYFLGYKVDQLKSDGGYVFEAFDFSNAVRSAKAIGTDGDYLTLLDLEGDYYMPPLSETPTEHEKKSDAENKLAAEKLRRRASRELLAHVEALISLADTPSPAPMLELCEVIEEFTDKQLQVTEALFRAFTDEEIFVLYRANIPNFLFDELLKISAEECRKGKGRSRETDSIENKLWEIYSKLDTGFAEIFQFEPNRYGPDKLAQFRPLDRSALPAKQPWPVFGYRQSNALSNSSTNYNRKRAAYMLKRFFCDDLTPVGFDTPQEHVAGTHGSQTTCFSCHYKLDPMAGFFRNYGANFSDVSGTSEILFDDAAAMDLETYLKNWRSPEVAGENWDIGYIRSPRWNRMNDYGHSLADLSGILRKAPEVKRCLMKRLTQYVLGENQTIDGGYLDALTEKFEKDAARSSAQAFKNAMASVLKSQTFQRRNADPDRCYDFSDGSASQNRPPCRIAYILEKNCVQCHDSAMSQNRLDLTSWTAGTPGAAPHFVHFNASDQPVPAAGTLGAIADRLTTNDPARRMPKNHVMSSRERQELFLWTQQERASRALSQ